MKFCKQVPFKINIISCIFRPRLSKKASTGCDGILDIVCGYYGISRAVLAGPVRQAELVEARQIAIYMIKKRYRDLKLREIGAFINRDHTTVLYSVKEAEKWLFLDREFSRNYAKIVERVNEVERKGCA